MDIWFQQCNLCHLIVTNICKNKWKLAQLYQEEMFIYWKGSFPNKEEEVSQKRKKVKVYLLITFKSQRLQVRKRSQGNVFGDFDFILDHYTSNLTLNYNVIN